MTCRRKLIVALAGSTLLLAAVMAVTGWSSAIYRYVRGADTVIEVRLIGIACGSHLQWEPRSLTVARGNRVRFVNTTPFWTVPVMVIASDTPDGPPWATSPPLRPGESWTYTFWKPGRFTVTSANPLQRWAGLQGHLTVRP